MSKVKKELEALKHKSQTQKETLKKNPEFIKLEAQLQWFANETTRLKQSTQNNEQKIS